MSHYRRAKSRQRRALILRILSDWNVKPWRPPVVRRHSMTIHVAGAVVTVAISKR